MKSARAIAFETRPSDLLCATLAGLALASAVAIGLSGVPFAPFFAAAVPIAALTAAWRYRRSGAWRVAWRDDDTWGVATLDGSAAADATLTGWNAVGHWLCLRFTLGPGRHLVLVLAADNADADVRRRLAVRLRRPCVVPVDVSLLP